jgi:DNA-binding transcriptional ArsR family regulator
MTNVPRKALKKAKLQLPKPPEPTPGSVLVHPTRRLIYSFICENPGSYYKQLGTTLDITAATVSWHLKTLVKKGFLKVLEVRGKKIYYPPQLRSPEAEALYTTLQNETTQRIFLHVLNNSAHSQTQIAKTLDLHHDTVRYHLGILENCQLIELIRDGRSVRALKGAATKRLQTGTLNVITDTFVAFLMKKLTEGCLHPEVVQQSNDQLTVRIECPTGEDIMLTLNLTDWQMLEGSQLGG